MSRSEDAAAVWRAMRALVLERNDRRGEVAQQLGLSFVRIKALRHAAQHPMALTELAAVLATDPPYTSVVVDDLVRRGLVERQPDPRDRRRKIVTATAAGRRVARRADRILGTPPDVLGDLPARDLATLRRILTGVVPDRPRPPA